MRFLRSRVGSTVFHAQRRHAYNTPRGPAGPAGPASRGGSSRKGFERGGRREGNTVSPILGEALFGTHPVSSALQFNSRPKIHSLYIQTIKGRDDMNHQLIAAAQQRGIPIVPVPKHTLDLMSGSRPHQGVVLDCDPLAPKRFEISQMQDIAHRGGLVLALDEVQDPQNLGAILRSSAFFGVDCIALSSKNSAPLSPVVSKASAGALELLVGSERLRQLPKGTNMPAMLKDASDSGFQVVGTDVGSGTESVAVLDSKLPTVMVFGNEGSGLRTNVKKQCTRLVTIPMVGADNGGLDSLNVSVSVGIMLWHHSHSMQS